MSTRTGTWTSGVATSLRSSAAPSALPRCRRRRRCCKPSERNPSRLAEDGEHLRVTGQTVVPLILLLLERAVGNDGGFLNAAEPAYGEIIPLPRDGEGAVRAAAAFFGLALGDDFDEEHIGFRLPDAGELPHTIEVRILDVRPLGANGELELVGHCTADLGELAVPIPDDVGARTRSRGPLLGFG